MKPYYILILICSFGLMGVFILLGANEVIHPFVAISGIIVSITGGIGACIDNKSRS